MKVKSDKEDNDDKWRLYGVDGWDENGIFWC